MKKEYIILDFNGTILDDLDLCLNAINQLLIKCHHTPIDKKYYLDIFTFPVRDYYLLAGFKFPEDNFESLSHQFMAIYQPNSLQCSLFKSILPLLTILKSKKIKIILLSASKKEYLIQQLIAFKIMNYFNVILANDNIYAAGKQLIAQDYVKNNHIPIEKVLMVGDTIHDFEIANQLGIECVLVTGGHQSEERLKTTKTKVVHDIIEILTYF